MQDILFFVPHRIAKDSKTSLYLDINHKYGYGDPYIDLSSCKITTGLCRNTRPDSLQNRIYKLVQEGKKNIYVIYYSSNIKKGLISSIMKVNKSQVFMNAEAAYIKGHRYPNNTSYNEQAEKDYPKTLSHPYIVGRLEKGTLSRYRLTEKTKSHYRLTRKKGVTMYELQIGGSQRRGTIQKLLSLCEEI